MVILCGGRGTRLQEHTRSIPKPMVEIGGRPILWHVLQIYLAQGFRRFLLLTGYRGEQIERFVAGEQWPAEAEIRCLDTGVDTPTGGRLHQAARELDGARLLPDLRRRRGRCRPRRPAGLPRRPRRAGDDDRGPSRAAVRRGRARGRRPGHRLRREAAQRALDQRRLLLPGHRGARAPRARHACSSATRWPRLAAAGELRAYRHEGFWDCMDTYKDAVTLDDLWASGRRAVEAVD